MTDEGLGESEEAVRPRLQAGASERNAVLGGELPAISQVRLAGLPGTRKTTLGNPPAFPDAATASLLTESAAPAQAPLTDAGT
jgi:hypothetical protein